jgi:hypothetical protein
MSRFEEYEFLICDICHYLITYGEYNDGEDTAERKREAWEESGHIPFIRYMSPACCGDEGECSFTTAFCELCGESGITGHTALALVPVSEHVTVRMTNTYACGRKTSGEHTVIGLPDAGDGGLDEWWETNALYLTGDGHPCGSSERALYEAEVIEAPGRPELVGATWSAEG